MLVMMAAQELANGVSYSGHLYAMTRAGRLLTPSGDLQETFGGMQQVCERFLSGVPDGGNLSTLFHAETSGEVHEEGGGDVQPDPGDPDAAQDQEAPLQP